MVARKWQTYNKDNTFGEAFGQDSYEVFVV